LARCVDIALNNNPGTRQAWQGAKAAAAQKQVADSIFYPSVTAGVNGIRNSAADYPFSSGQTIKDSFQPNVQITYVLFNFGGNYASSQSARDAMYAANYTYNRALQNVTLSVEENFYNLRADEASVDAARFNVKTRNMFTIHRMSVSMPASARGRICCARRRTFARRNFSSNRNFPRSKHPARPWRKSSEWRFHLIFTRRK